MTERLALSPGEGGVGSRFGRGNHRARPRRPLYCVHTATELGGPSPCKATVAVAQFAGMLSEMLAMTVNSASNVPRRDSPTDCCPRGRVIATAGPGILTSPLAVPVYRSPNLRSRLSHKIVTGSPCISGSQPVPAIRGFPSIYVRNWMQWSFCFPPLTPNSVGAAATSGRKANCAASQRLSRKKSNGRCVDGLRELTSESIESPVPSPPGSGTGRRAREGSPEMGASTPATVRRQITKL